MHMNLDPFLVDKIVGEVKSQGFFDQFRKDSMSDVDTKPAYQNLRQRVESTVSKFLSEQIWTPELNKNQLREKLRKHITEAGFLDTGVERIVDQVVNPKISTVFQPKIEDIAYKFLGIEKPLSKIEEKPPNFTNGDLTIKTDFLPTDLEAVSPDSDKVTDEKSESKLDMLNDSDDKNEEFESPPFEPLEGLERPPSVIEKKDDSNHSQLSGISGLTSQDSLEDAKVEDANVISQIDATQESVLSEVSSNSRLSIVTNGGDESKPEMKEETDVGISEEAQMPKFNDSTSSNPENGGNLHFDIKKEEIIFEGTDRKSEKRDYFACISEGLPKNNTEEITTEQTDDLIKVELDDINVEKDQSSKNGEASASSSLTYSSTDTQISSTSKLTDDDKYEKVTKSTSENFSEENNGQNPPTSEDQEKILNTNNERHQSVTSILKEKSHNQKKSHKKSSSDREKYSSSENNSRHSAESRHDHYSSSGKKYKSSSDEYRNKSHSHKSKHSKDKRDRTRERSGSRNRKHKSDKDENGKNSDTCSDQKKKYRRKSTDSNDDAQGSKDTSKNASNSSLDKIDRAKVSNNSSSSNYSTNTNGSVEDNALANAARNVLSMRERNEDDTAQLSNYPKPIILDGLLINNVKNNIELIIGTNVIIDSKQTYEENKTIPDGENNENSLNENELDLEYFTSDPQDDKTIETIIEKLSAAIEKNKTTSLIHTMNCDEEFDSIFKKSKFNVIKILEKQNYSKNSQSKNMKEPKSSTKINGKISDNSRKNQKNLNSIISNSNLPYRKRKINSEDCHYQSKFCVFTNEKIPNDSNSLIIDCFEYGDNEQMNKKVKGLDFPVIEEESFAKMSPTASEFSLGSKENDYIEKLNSEKCEKLDNTVVREKRNASLKASQRYTSEDLYKPRPVLGQRSKRRGVEADVM